MIRNMSIIMVLLLIDDKHGHKSGEGNLLLKENSFYILLLSFLCLSHCFSPPAAPSQRKQRRQCVGCADADSETRSTSKITDFTPNCTRLT